MKKENKTGSAIEVQGLSKEYVKGIKVLDNASLEVKKGEIFGLLGPNGAGKTTLLSILSTMRKPSSGNARVNGFDVERHPEEVRKSIGMVFQDPSLDDELTALENLELHSAMYGLNAMQARERIKETIKLVGLEGKLNTIVKTFSGGMKRRLEIARGLIHKPKVLFLDEPTIGLDPQTRAGIWQYIKELNSKEKTTIILTTHYMDEADSVCSRIAIIDLGKIIAIDSQKNLKNKLGGDLISIECKASRKCIEGLKKEKWVKETREHDGFIDVRVEKGEEKIPKLLRILEKSKVKVNSVNLRKPSLDDVFLHYTGRTIREEEASAKDNLRQRFKATGKRK
jgi:ABC-2 type transport system ATP-binding protein